MNTRHLTASALLIGTLGLTGCSGDGAASASPATGGPAPAASAQGSDAEVAFLSEMRPHHEQAVLMSDLVLAADPPAEVAALARRIKAAQSPELDQIEGMLADLGHGTDRMAHGSGAAGHDGMLSEADMTALRAATGTRAARLYLEGMIGHHRGAVEASDTELGAGTPAPARALARRIRQVQLDEVTTMQTLLQGL